MSQHSPRSVLVRLASAVSASLLLASLAVADDPIPWRTDLQQARADARAANKPVLVVIHQVGEAGSDTMVRDVLRQPRFVAAARDVVPVLACCFGENAIGQVGCDFPGLRIEELRAGELATRTALFGRRAEIVTPQHLLLDARGGVLWHSVRQIGLQQMLEGVKLGLAEFRKAPKDRVATATRLASDLLRAAEHEPESYTRLRTLAVHAQEQQFRPVIDVVATRPALCERILRDASTTLSTEVAEQRLGLVASNTRIKGLVADLLREVRGRRQAETARSDTLRLDRPPRPLFRAEPLTSVRFADGRARPLEELAGTITVLWFFLPSDPTLREQATQLAPVCRELEARGVRFLGLACCADQTEAAAAAQRAGLTFPVGAYLPPSGRRLYDVACYPSVVVIDPDLNVVLADGTDSESMRTSYTGFARLVRGMLPFVACAPGR